MQKKKSGDGAIAKKSYAAQLSSVDRIGGAPCRKPLKAKPSQQPPTFQQLT